MSRYDSIADVIGHHASLTPDRVALVTEDVGVDYRELQARSCLLAGALTRCGVERGDRVSYLGKNSTEFFYLVIAAAQLGAIVVPLNWRLALPELLQIAHDASPKVLLVGPGLSDVGARISAVYPSITTVALDDEGAQELPDSVQLYETWLGTELFVPLPIVASEDVAMLVYTSGTTGRPKGAMISHRSLLLHLQALAAVAGMSATSVSISTLPVFHIGGSSWVLAGLWAGCTTIQFRDVVPARILQAVAEHKATNMIAVPSVIQLLVDAVPAGADFTSLQRLYYGGGPVSSSVLSRALDVFHCDFVQGFGMTECALVTALEPKFHARPELLRSCGRPIADTEVRLVGEGTDVDVPIGSVGELWVRSPRVMSGYWNKPEISAETLAADGWLRTGDAASMDSEGFLYIRDRLKDMIITGGENVYCAEVENVLMEHPDIVECAVIGVPSERWSETVKAIVVLAENASADQAQLVEFCRQRLAGFKCPTSVDFVRDLPRTPSGKLQKFVLREQYWQSV